MGEVLTKQADLKQPNQSQLWRRKSKGMLNPKPSKLQALDPTNPQPSTLKTLNPKPYKTPNPKPR